MRIGQVASQAGVNIDTLRYYERRGILDEPARRPSGYREYPADTVRIIRFIRRAQDLGFTLTEIEELLELRDARAGSRSQVRKLADAKLRSVDGKLSALQAMRSALYSLLQSCTCSEGKPSCPILDALDPPDASPEVKKPRRNHGRA